MQSENKNDSVRLSDRYLQYTFAKRHLGGERTGQVFPLGEDDEKDIEPSERSEAGVLPTIRATHYKSGDNQPLIQQLNNPTHSNNRIYADAGISPALNTAQGGNRQPKIVANESHKEYNGVYDKTKSERPESQVRVLPEAVNQEEVRGTTNGLGSLQADKVLQPNVYEKSVQGSVASSRAEVDGGTLPGKADLPEGISLSEVQAGKEANGYTPQGREREEQCTIKSNRALPELSSENTPFRIRRLTPVEAERLMGLPDGWLKYGADGKEISDSQRYKMAGNGVVVNVVEAVISKILSLTHL